jgi:hypothetical protein
MSLYQIALIVFLIAVGLLFVFGLGHVVQVIAGIAALVAAVMLLVGK